MSKKSQLKRNICTKYMTVGHGTTFPIGCGTGILPLEVQQQIVSKVNQLMQLCDELEEQVKQSKEEAERLMQAVLREVLKGHKD